MKPRRYSLPLVILLSLSGLSRVAAQQIAHITLFEYFDRIPQAPEFPNNNQLTSSKPELFEENADLISLQKDLETSLKINTKGGEIVKAGKLVNKLTESTGESVKGSLGDDGLFDYFCG